MSTEDQFSLKKLALVSKSVPHLHQPELRVPYTHVPRIDMGKSLTRDWPMFFKEI